MTLYLNVVRGMIPGPLNLGPWPYDTIHDLMPTRPLALVQTHFKAQPELPEDSKLGELLIMRPPKDMRQLMRRIEEYKRIEDDRQQSKGKALVTSQPKQGGFQSEAECLSQESEHGIQGTSAQDYGSDQKRAVFSVAEQDGR